MLGMKKFDKAGKTSIHFHYTFLGELTRISATFLGELLRCHYTFLGEL